MGGKDTKGADTKAAFSRESGSTSAFQFCVYYTVKKRCNYSRKQTKVLRFVMSCFCCAAFLSKLNLGLEKIT